MKMFVDLHGMLYQYNDKGYETNLLITTSNLISVRMHYNRFLSSSNCLLQMSLYMDPQSAVKL